jgi:hypothetical protein
LKGFVSSRSKGSILEILPHRTENIQNPGGMSTHLYEMLNPSRIDYHFSSLNQALLIADFELQLALQDVGGLFMRMAVPGQDAAGFQVDQR